MRPKRASSSNIRRSAQPRCAAYLNSVRAKRRSFFECFLRLSAGIGVLGSGHEFALAMPSQQATHRAGGDLVSDSLLVGPANDARLGYPALTSGQGVQ